MTNKKVMASLLITALLSTTTFADDKAFEARMEWAMAKGEYSAKINFVWDEILYAYKSGDEIRKNKNKIQKTIVTRCEEIANDAKSSYPQFPNIYDYNRNRCLDYMNSSLSKFIF